LKPNKQRTISREGQKGGGGVLHAALKRKTQNRAAVGWVGIAPGNVNQLLLLPKKVLVEFQGQSRGANVGTDRIMNMLLLE